STTSDTRNRNESPGRAGGFTNPDIVSKLLRYWHPPPPAIQRSGTVQHEWRGVNWLGGRGQGSGPDPFPCPRARVQPTNPKSSTSPIDIISEIRYLVPSYDCRRRGWRLFYTRETGIDLIGIGCCVGLRGSDFLFSLRWPRARNTRRSR